MKKRILFVINTLGHAGAEMSMLELMKCFDFNQYEISLYVLMGQGELIHHLLPEVKVLNKNYCDTSVLLKTGNRNMIKTICHAAIKHANILRLFPYMLSSIHSMMKNHNFQKEKILWRIVSDGADRFEDVYDLAIAYLEGGSAYYVADHVKAKKKAAYIHIDYNRAGYTRQLDLDCYLGYDRVFTVSEEVKVNFLKTYPECEAYTRIFHNRLDVSTIIEKSKEPVGFADEFTGSRLLTVGRLTAQKAYDIAIDAMMILKRRGINARWYVLGEGPERKKLEKQIEDAGLTQDFLLLGAISNPYPYYVQSTLYIHATRFEGKSIAIQEAQILGCAIIASDCSGNREQIEHGSDGILCEMNADKIADCIIDLIKDKDQRKSFSEAAARKEINKSGEVHQLLELLET